MEYLGGIAAAILIIHGIKQFTKSDDDDVGGEYTPMTPVGGYPPGTTPRTPGMTPQHPDMPPQQTPGGTRVLDPYKTITAQEDFVTAAMSRDGAFIAITAEWCGHCKAMKSEFEAARQASSVPMYWVDTKDFSEDDLKGIEGFPTLRYYIGGRGKDYNGPRTAAGMLEFINKQT